MVQFLFAVLSLAVALTALILLKTYYYLPRKEMQRQAAAHQALAKILWRAVAFGSSLKVLLWFFVAVFGAVGFVLFSRVAPPLFGFVVVAATLLFAFAWLPNTRLTSIGGQIAAWCTPTVVWLLNNLRPVLEPVSRYISKYPLGAHTGLYEKEDLVDALEQQKTQPDNRISPEALDIAKQALQFDNYVVADVLIPRSHVKVISAQEPVGPVLLDELHASNHVRFPVYDGDPNTIKGTLYLQDIVDSKQGGVVANYADKHVHYIHEADSLAEALHAFRVSKQPLLVAVNSFEEYVGIVTLSDVLGKLISFHVGHRPAGHEDKHAVARKHEKPPAAEPQHNPLAENPPEVIE